MMKNSTLNVEALPPGFDKDFAPRYFVRVGSLIACAKRTAVADCKVSRLTIRVQRVNP